MSVGRCAVIDRAYRVEQRFNPSQRMREIDSLEHLETASAAECHGCADEIAKAIDRAYGRLIEIRNEKALWRGEPDDVR